MWVHQMLLTAERRSLQVMSLQITSDVTQRKKTKLGEAVLESACPAVFTPQCCKQAGLWQDSASRSRK